MSRSSSPSGPTSKSTSIPARSTVLIAKSARATTSQAPTSRGRAAANFLRNISRHKGAGLLALDAGGFRNRRPSRVIAAQRRFEDLGSAAHRDEIERLQSRNPLGGGNDPGQFGG